MAILRQTDVSGSLNISGSLTITSNTLVPNLNAQLLNGQLGTFYQSASNLVAGTISDTRLSANVPLLNAQNIFTVDQSIVQDKRFKLSGSSVNVTEMATGWGQGYLLMVNLDFTGSLDPLTSLAYTQNIGASGTGGAYVRIDANSKIMRFGFASASVGSGSSANPYITESVTFSPTSINANVPLVMGGATVLSATRALSNINGIAFQTDNANDIGALGATRPRTIFVGTNLTAGGIVSGSNFVAGASSSAGANIAVNGAPGNYRTIQFQTGNQRRWFMGADTSAETGTNAGSQFVLWAYDDSDVRIDQTLQIPRAAGSAMLLTRPLNVTGGSVTIPNGTLSTGNGTITFGIAAGLNSTLILNGGTGTSNLALRGSGSTLVWQSSLVDSWMQYMNFADSRMFIRDVVNARMHVTYTPSTTTPISSFNSALVFDTDNTYDIGASGGNRPRNVYVAGAVTGALGAVFGVPAITNGDTQIANSLTIREGTGGTATASVLSNAATGFAKFGIGNIAAGGSLWELFVGGNNVSGTGGIGINEGNFQIRIGGGQKFLIDKTTFMVTTANDLAVSGSARFVQPAFALFNSNLSSGGTSLTIGVPGSSQGNITFGNANTATGLGVVGFASGSGAGDFQISSGGGSGTIRLVLPSGGGDVAKFANGSATINSALYVSGSATILGAGIVNGTYNKITVRGDNATANVDVAEIGFVRSNYNPGENAAAIVFARESGAAEGALSFRTQNANASLTERLRVGAAGLVTAFAGLTVTGSTNILGAVGVQGNIVAQNGNILQSTGASGTNPQLRITQTGVTDWTITNTATIGNLRIAESSNVKMDIAANGNVNFPSGSVTASTLVVSSSFGTSYAQTALSGSYSVIDTGLFVNQIGPSAIYDLVVTGNPNSAGSTSYRILSNGRVYVGTGFNGSVVTSYIDYLELFREAPGTANTTLVNVDVSFVSASVQSYNCVDGSVNHQIRVVVGPYTTTTGTSQTVRLTRVL